LGHLDSLVVVPRIRVDCQKDGAEHPHRQHRHHCLSKSHNSLVVSFLRPNAFHQGGLLQKAYHIIASQEGLFFQFTDIVNIDRGGFVEIAR
jgi:hypothetical protein